MKRKKKLVLSIVSVSVIIFAAGIFLYPIFRYIDYRNSIRNSFPNDLYQEFPISLSRNGYFQLKCLINNRQQVNLSIDTKATSLMREDSITQYDGKYWGNMPFSSSNAYNEKTKIALYSFNTIKIGDNDIQKPLFKSIPKDNLIYDVVGEGVFGSDLLSIGCWKFDMDNKILKLFHYKNQILLEKEVKGLVKIENGLEDDAIAVYLGQPKQEFRFTLDLGYSGMIEINNDIADILKEKHAYDKIRKIYTDGVVDTLYVFENIPVTIAGIEIENCQLLNIRRVNGNYLGAKFIRNFNFLLEYGEENGHNCKHLFLNQQEAELSKYTCKLVSKFGFGLNRHKGKTVIGSITSNSIADKAGLIPGDIVLEINDKKHNFLSIDDIEHTFIQYADTLDRLEIKTQKGGAFSLIHR